MRTIFLHSGWRTGSTYVWTKFRQASDCMAFYEPFNEFLVRMSAADVYLAQHDLQTIRHSVIGRPYFHEYLPLLRGTGMPLFELDFSYRNYFVVDDPLPSQRAYLDSLCQLALRSRKRPVLGFVRSLGRVGWFRRQYKDAVNIVVLRSPLAQWMSGRELARSTDQEFFDPMHLFILSQARGSQSVIDLAARFGIPRLENEPFGATKQLMFELVRNWTPAERFRVFAWLYVTEYLASLPYADVVIDTDALSADARVQAQAVTEIRDIAGVELSFADANMPRHIDADIAADVGTVLAELCAALADNDVPMPHAGIAPALAERARTTILRKFEADRRFLTGSLDTAA